MLTDQEAEEFVQRNWALAHRVITARARWYHGFQRDQVISDGQLALWELARKYDPSQGPEGQYVVRRIKWRLIDLYRERTPYNRSAWKPEESALNDYLVNTVPDRTDPIGDVVDGMALEQVMSELEPRHRDVLIAYFIDGRTMAQIAKGLAVTESRVSQKISEALKTARKISDRQKRRANRG